MKRIVLHGYLKNLHDGDFVVSAESAYEAVKAFMLQTKALKPKASSPEDMKHQIVIVGFDNLDQIFKKTDVDEIHLAPAFICGSSSKGLVQIGIGAVLIAASFYMPGSWAFTVGATQITASGVAFMMGASLVLGGILQLISPAPELNENASKPSRLLGTPKNTVGIGTVIPVLYGTHKVYGHILAYDVDATNIKNNRGK